MNRSSSKFSFILWSWLLFSLLVTVCFAQPQTLIPNQEREAAKALYQQGKTVEAVKALRSYLSDSRNQKDGDAWLYLGLAFYQNKQISDARDAFKRAVKLNPQSEAAHINYAYALYAEGGKVKEAEKEANQAIKLNPNNPGALYLRGLIRIKRGDCPKAIEDANAALKLNPQFANAYLLKAQAILEQSYLKVRAGSGARGFSGDQKKAFGEAAQNIEKYIQLKPADSEAKFWRERIAALRYYAGEENSLGCVKSNEPGITLPKITYKEKSKYTEEARQNGIHGTIAIRAIFDVDGTLKHITPITYLPHGLTWEAVKAAQKIRFYPATKNGKPVCMAVTMEFSFNPL